ncbi:mitochondrial carnitine/acylcarnitine carrier protein CACL-like [Tropilaelaps mercedesae]|uniref:Mitochondrial basic amino acids transporter n=1 Tax=Tropilaelaps mercedesae TaxID=418985 RepID=A0A1V9XA16_9ACAR|nr:mitochondrial carnitine/acylcarnitine carrier protein CACL-like [Tropilaelaps mercedesae]
MSWLESLLRDEKSYQVYRKFRFKNGSQQLRRSKHLVIKHRQTPERSEVAFAGETIRRKHFKIRGTSYRRSVSTKPTGIMDFVVGWISGCAGVIVGHPFDTVKVRLQTQDAAKPKYRNTIHCFTTILKAESAPGLFRGMTSPMAGIPFVNAILFGVYGTTRKLFTDQDSLSTHFCAGMVAGGVQSAITSPMELIKTRLQLQDETSKPVRTLQKYRTIKPRYSGPLDCARQIFRNEGGVRGLSKGLGSTLLRDAPGIGVYFASYEYLYRSAVERGSGGPAGVSTTSILMAGGLAGVLSWTVCYPIDVVKSRIQGGVSSAGFVDTALRLYRREGTRSFVRGVNSALLRAYPTNAAIFFTATTINSLYEKYASGTATLMAVEERLVETVQQQMHQHHLHHHFLAERMHLHTISNHL